MSWTIVDYAAVHTPALRQLYWQARRQAFTWLDAAGFQLSDFDTVTQGETVLVALQQKVPVGFIAWWPPDNFIHSLFVAPDVAGRGAGTALLRAALARMGRPATLKCLQQNAPAVAFYRARGWTIREEGKSAEGAYFLLSLE
ncbi:GNAT family N-acetyltransferase [Hymenobacter metallicola]|uniref:GNAT family N-acetyltransferase n=1 Tax=Hymenobacter metallicola TaxID=2563114 RepID=A0A4Z0Q032_9BACT|nr:GNAT family N-acetyltransferase [Hymenobacter metallicola]TGE23388.1 GNAT family N-acetyltransferase [Hymenobacter metallicola]